MNLRDLRLHALIAPPASNASSTKELAFHIERETQKHVANGLSPQEARARAWTRFGSTARAAEECRDARGAAFVDTCLRDVLYALRTFRRRPFIESGSCRRGLASLRRRS
jgi:hypothetical protein